MSTPSIQFALKKKKKVVTQLIYYIYTRINIVTWILNKTRRIQLQPYCKLRRHEIKEMIRDEGGVQAAMNGPHLTLVAEKVHFICIYTMKVTKRIG